MKDACTCGHWQRDHQGGRYACKRCPAGRCRSFDSQDKYPLERPPAGPVLSTVVFILMMLFFWGLEAIHKLF